MVVDCPWKGVAAADDHHYALGVAGRDGPDRVRGAIACAYSLIAGQGRTMRVRLGSAIGRSRRPLPVSVASSTRFARVLSIVPCS